MPRSMRLFLATPTIANEKAKDREVIGDRAEINWYCEESPLLTQSAHVPVNEAWPMG